MNIVSGRGNNRKVIELPCGYLVAKTAKQDNATYNANLKMLCGVLGVPESRGRF